VAVVHRDITLLVGLAILTAIAFAGTAWVAAGNREMHRDDASQWFGRAQRALDEGRTPDAVAALRRATTQDPEYREYRLALASALAQEGVDAEARQILLALRERQPEDPDINLRLARLEVASESGLTDKIRYYQMAIASLWSDEDLDSRRQVRVELIRLLLARGQRSRALSELLLLGVNLPDNPESEIEIAELFLQAGDSQRALEGFTDALADEPESERGLAGAGEAAFELEDYASARRYLARVSPDNVRARRLGTVSALVLDQDPLAARLGTAERRRRLVTIFEHAIQNLEDCAIPRPGQAGDTLRYLDPLRIEASEFAEQLRSASAVQVRDAVEEGLDLVNRLQQAVGKTCGASAPLDEALARISRRHGLDAS